MEAEKLIHPLDDVDFILTWSIASKPDSLMKKVKKNQRIKAQHI